MTNKKLTSSEKKHFRNLAHSLEPLIRVGKNGISPNVLNAISELLGKNGLIKIKLLIPKTSYSDTIAQIEKNSRCELVGLVGSVAILYRDGIIKKTALDPKAPIKA